MGQILTQVKRVRHYRCHRGCAAAEPERIAHHRRFGLWLRCLWLDIALRDWGDRCRHDSIGQPQFRKRYENERLEVKSGKERRVRERR